MNLSALKANLTRAKRSGDPRKVIDACDEAFARFEAHGYPDCWHTFNIARQDAVFALQRLGE